MLLQMDHPSLLTSIVGRKSLIIFIISWVLESCKSPFFISATGQYGSPAVHPYTTSAEGWMEARPHSWPWHGFLNSQRGLLCTVVLVDRQWVLTTAWCGNRRAHGRRYVMLGRHYLSLGFAYEGVQQIPIAIEDGNETVRVVPEYAARRDGSHDMAMIKLQYPVTFTDHILPIRPFRFGDAFPPVGSLVYLVAAHNGHTLRQGTLRIIDAVSADATTFRAGDRLGTVIENDYDTGAPLVHYDERDRQWKLLGIASGPSANTFVRVSAYDHFIHQQVGLDLLDSFSIPPEYM